MGHTAIRWNWLTDYDMLLAPREGCHGASAEGTVAGVDACGAGDAAAAAGSYQWAPSTIGTSDRGISVVLATGYVLGQPPWS